ncbi:MAG: hypothetical protein OXI16_14585 [Chloroflexota bacterium]|nr:hypothetical protein [Chloroflexota bacterium]
MPESIYIEVDENDNCEYMPLMLYEAHADAVPVTRVVLDEPGRAPGEYQVTGWSSDNGGTPCAAMYCPVSDSGQAVVHLVFGGDWGIRMKPANSAVDWSIDDPEQFGEPYIMLLDASAVILNESAG